MDALNQILYWASINYHPLYEKYLLEEHEDKYGPHFNEQKALEAVSKMHHRSNSGTEKGEHWSIEQAKDVENRYRGHLPSNVTCWDIYVALNMWWHDLEMNYRKHGLSESNLIEDALTWAFCDEDAPEGKIWYYIYAM